MMVWPTMQRQVNGGVGATLRDVGIDFTKDISLWALPAMTATRGGLDLVMATTFAVRSLASVPRASTCPDESSRRPEAILDTAHPLPFTPCRSSY